MNLNTLKPAEGEKTSRKRVGRGIGSGMGKTCGRGHKGQKFVLVVLLKSVLKVVRCPYKEDCLKLVLLHAFQESLRKLLCHN